MNVMECVGKGRVIAIVRGLAPERLLDLAEALYAGGIDLVEITFDQTRPDSWQGTADAIRAISTRMAGKVLPGAGTVLIDAQLRLAADAGACYIITPNVNPALIEQVKKAGLCAFPGAMTPTEIFQAHQAGADAVKVFPAGLLGASFIKAVRAPLSHIPLMAVGGVNEKSAGQFIAAGCVCVGVGGDLVNKEWVAAGQWDQITALAKEYRRAVGS